MIAKAKLGVDPEDLRDSLRSELSGVEVLTATEFAQRSAAYWMLETGIGVTVIITAVLGFSVGALVTSQTLFGITNDHLPNFATLRAVGFSQAKLVGIVLTQSLILGGLGTLVGSALFFAAAHASARTPIPLETTPLIFSCLVVTNLLVCVASSLLAIRTVLRIDPVAVFGGQG
ncbi:FtsX-like permease family protein [bacterium]|nr:FtsX-like permease family protein [bacterium]